MHTRIRYEKSGGHYHLTVFTGKSAEVTHANAGTLCMREDVFEAFKSQWRGDVEWYETCDKRVKLVAPKRERKAEPAMFTRKQYLNKECTHRQYYDQFVE